MISEHKPSKLSLWLPLILWISLIFFFSTDLFSRDETEGIIIPFTGLILGWILPASSHEAVHVLFRKAAHMGEYGILGMLWYRAMNRGLKGWDIRPALWALSLSLLSASADEYHQTFTADREGKVLDVTIDTSGILIALGIIWLYNRGKSLNSDTNGRRKAV